LAEPNDDLRRARERVESPNATGQPLSRQELAELVNAWVYEHTTPPKILVTDANYLGQLERGRIRWPQDPDRRAGFRAVLNVSTDAELGFRRPRRTRSTVADVDRQQFIRASLGATAGTLTGACSFADLIAPTQPRPVPSVVGQTEVVEVRTVAQVFAGLDNRFGGGLLRQAVVAELGYYAECLNAHCSEQVRAELFSAVGQFAQVAGFMAFDAYAHEDARRMYRFALNCAEEAGDWHLRAKVLACMSRQATWCGDPDQGVTFTELALVRSDRLTATERSMLHTDRSRALARLGRVQDAVAAVGLADEEFSHSRPANDPATVHYFDAGVHAGETGRALWDVAVHHGQFLAEARHRLSTAATAKGEKFVRGRVMDQIKIASLVMATGDPDEAVMIGTRALDVASTIRSQRAADFLRELRHLSGAHKQHPGVAELIHRIGTAVVI
jgi:hypothetical protein